MSSMAISLHFLFPLKDTSISVMSSCSFQWKSKLTWLLRLRIKRNWTGCMLFSVPSSCRLFSYVSVLTGISCYVYYPRSTLFLLNRTLTWLLKRKCCAFALIVTSTSKFSNMSSSMSCECWRPHSMLICYVLCCQPVYELETEPMQAVLKFCNTQVELNALLGVLMPHVSEPPGSNELSNYFELLNSGVNWFLPIKRVHLSSINCIGNSSDIFAVLRECETVPFVSWTPIAKAAYDDNCPYVYKTSVCSSLRKYTPTTFHCFSTDFQALIFTRLLV